MRGACEKVEGQRQKTVCIDVFSDKERGDNSEIHNSLSTYRALGLIHISTSNRKEILL